MRSTLHPAILCNPEQFNQGYLYLIVNSANATLHISGVYSLLNVQEKEPAMGKVFPVIL